MRPSGSYWCRRFGPAVNLQPEPVYRRVATVRSWSFGTGGGSHSWCRTPGTPLVSNCVVADFSWPVRTHTLVDAERQNKGNAVRSFCHPSVDSATVVAVTSDSPLASVDRPACSSDSSAFRQSPLFSATLSAIVSIASSATVPGRNACSTR